MSELNLKDLYNWCSIPVNQLENHPQLKTPFRMVKESTIANVNKNKQFSEQLRMFE